MSKKTNLKIADAVQGVEEEMMMDFMGGAMKEMSASMQTEQKVALGLTKLALGCVENPTVDDVFDLFERSASFIGEVYPSPFAE